MTEKTPPPSVAFDPKKHVLAGRQLKDGRQLFFSLSSIVAAEKAIETPAPAAASPTPAPITNGVTHDDLIAFEERIVKAARAAAPPPQFPADIVSTMTDLTKAAVAMKQENETLRSRVAKLEADNAVFTQNFAAFKAMTGAGT